MLRCLCIHSSRTAGPFRRFEQTKCRLACHVFSLRRTPCRNAARLDVNDRNWEHDADCQTLAGCRYKRIDVPGGNRGKKTSRNRELYTFTALLETAVRRKLPNTPNLYGAFRVFVVQALQQVQNELLFRTFWHRSADLFLQSGERIAESPSLVASVPHCAPWC